jgi:PAS domain S-box-containing protein
VGEINTTALRDDGTIVGVHGVSRDITWRKQAEAALQESEQRWRSLVENAPDTVLTVDREGRVLFINRPLTSPTAQEALGKDVTASVRSDNREEVQATIQRVFETGEPGYVEAAAAGPGGVTAWYAARMGPVWREGEVAAALVVVRNITEQKRLEEMKDNLIRDVSHELRTPLSKMQMGMELLMELIAREAIDRRRVARIGEVTTSNVQRLLHTVETILDLSALEAGHTAYRMEPLGLAGLIDDVVYDMQPLAEAKGLELRAEVPERLPPIRADWQHLFRVLTNLIDNAIKFTDEGAVVVSAQQKDTELEIAVSDSGRGISKQSLPRLFERFFQETPGTTPGLGAGLAICRTITEAHGGRIWVESAGHGLGSTFRVRLPLESSPDAGA